MEDRDFKERIIVNVDSKTKEVLDLALKYLDLTLDDAFDKFVKELVRQVSRSYLGETNTNYFLFKDVNLVKERLESRINKWARNKSGVYYFILRSYFLACHGKSNDVGAEIDEMEYIFNRFVPDRGSTISRFRMNFRLLCSDAPRAYGKLFDYNKDTKMVRVAEKYVSLVYSLKDEFLSDNIVLK